MTKKIDFTKIILDNINTFKRHGTGSWMILDFAIFLGFPLLLAALICCSTFVLKNDLVTAVITAASIFAGLLLNLLVLIYTIFIRDKENIQQKCTALRLTAWEQLIEETFSNISFCILASILLVAFSLLFYLEMEYLKSIIEFLIYFLSTALILHLFMVLKRVHALITFEFETAA